jgi:hypothetical protein
MTPAQDKRTLQRLAKEAKRAAKARTRVDGLLSAAITKNQTPAAKAENINRKTHDSRRS